MNDRIVSTIMDLPALGLTRARKKHGVAPETVSRVGHARGWLGKEYRTSKRGKSVFSGWRVTAQVTAPVLETDGTYHEGVVFDLRNGRTIGRYWHAVLLLRDGKPLELRHMGAVEIVDTDGRRYRLMTNPNAVLTYYESLSDEERERFGQTIGSEKVTVRRGRAA